MKEEIDLEELAPWLTIFITLAGGVLRLLLLDYRGMGADETFSIWLASHSLGDVLRWTATIDQQPPLYYLLLHAWMALYQDTPHHVRLLSVLFGTAAIPLIYLIGKRLSGPKMGLTAAVLLALSPFNIRLAQETRMYTLLTFNAAVAIYALVRLLTDPRTGRPIGSQLREYWRAWQTAAPAAPDTTGDFTYQVKLGEQTGWRAWVARHRWPPIRAIETDLAWIAFIVFSAATLLTHNAAILLPLSTNIYVLGMLLLRRHKRTGAVSDLQAPSFANWVKAQLGIALLWSPWAIAFVRQVSGVWREFWLPAPGWGTVIEALKAFLNAPTPTPHPAVPIPVIWMLYALVLGLGIWHYRQKPARLLLLAALFVIPIVGELLISMGRPVFYDRTMVWITLPLLLVLAAGIVQLRYGFLIIAMVGILGTSNLFSASDYFRFTQKEDWATAAGYVANFAEQDDLVLFHSTWMQIPFDYYFRTYEKQYAIRVEKHGVPGEMFERRVLEPQMTARDVPGLVALLDGRQRVWLVYSRDWYTDPEGLIPQTLASQMQLVRQRHFYGGQVQLYEAP